VRALEELRELGLWRVAVAATPGAQPIDTIDAALPLCLVLGAEGSGVRSLVAKNCDFHAVIPMAEAQAQAEGDGRGAIGSFNVSVAAALALYDIRRRRGQPAGAT
jgi:23S rRNA (guanosine2251-2'-O)-methyltransferase